MTQCCIQQQKHHTKNTTVCCCVHLVFLTQFVVVHILCSCDCHHSVWMHNLHWPLPGGRFSLLWHLHPCWEWSQYETCQPGVWRWADHCCWIGIPTPVAGQPVPASPPETAGKSLWKTPHNIARWKTKIYTHGDHAMFPFKTDSWEGGWGGWEEHLLAVLVCKQIRFQSGFKCSGRPNYQVITYKIMMWSQLALPSWLHFQIGLIARVTIVSPDERSELLHYEQCSR